MDKKRCTGRSGEAPRSVLCQHQKALFGAPILPQKLPFRPYEGRSLPLSLGRALRPRGRAPGLALYLRLLL